MSDRLGEAKASGNLGNTLKVMGKFEEAVICCRRHLEICQEHSDKVGIGRALYNLGNVYHAKVKPFTEQKQGGSLACHMLHILILWLDRGSNPGKGESNL